MSQVSISWNPNPNIEQISKYKIYIDGTVAGEVMVSSFVDPLKPLFTMDLAPGVHTVEVSAVNVWEEGPKSDPIATPSAATKPTGVNISITVNVTVGT
jgi:hypothetical protein